MWVDLESCKGLTEMTESERNKLVFYCWKCMVDEKVKMADVNTKMEEEIKRLKAEVVYLRRELEDERKLKVGEDARSKRKVDGEVNDGARRVVFTTSRVNEKMKGHWTEVNRRKMIEMNRINDRDERNRVNEKMNGSWIKVGGRKINEMEVMKVRMTGSNGCTSLRRKGIKEICEYAEKVTDDMDEGMVIVQGAKNGLLENGSEATVNAIMKVVERARDKTGL
ncbi:hypothetical protein FHG87_025037 [Trinorchestia longiramus]|nr:hypothetical protein FHG87_025037 [Trinorchestia longiramus]